MKSLGAGLENGVDVASAVASLAGVVEEVCTLNSCTTSGLGSGVLVSSRDVVIGGADAFDQIVVVVLALAVDLDADIAAAQCSGGVQVTWSPRTASAVVGNSASPMAGRG